MIRFEVTKTVEAVQLNKRTLRILTGIRETIPYGSVVTDVTRDRGKIRFYYLGEPFEGPEDQISSALKEIE